ncbi:hypothetical protein C8R46DRAFT_342870 [Mycena filopes]|nr:hypothetical protein C8R46DRAFT_342870 [Mycena filopes]
MEVVEVETMITRPTRPYKHSVACLASAGLLLPTTAASHADVSCWVIPIRTWTEWRGTGSLDSPFSAFVLRVYPWRPCGSILVSRDSKCRSRGCTEMPCTSAPLTRSRTPNSGHISPLESRRFARACTPRRSTSLDKALTSYFFLTCATWVAVRACDRSSVMIVTGRVWSLTTSTTRTRTSQTSLTLERPDSEFYFTTSEMLQFREFSAWITIDGQQTPEYAVEVSEDKRTVTCWIASELGKRFSVDWRNSSYPHLTRGRVAVDGNYCGGKLIKPMGLPKFASKTGIRDTHCLKPFVFSTLELTDDDAFLGGPTHEDLGVIRLTISAVELIGETANPRKLALSELKVHERSKKAVTQQITLAKPEFSQRPKVIVTTTTIGPHLVKFLFKYRPADGEVLRANGIVPQLKPKPSSEPVRPLTPDDTLADDEEERKLRERLGALEAKRLKRDTKPRVKREADNSFVDLTQPRHRKKVKMEGFVPAEIIDLA